VGAIGDRVWLDVDGDGLQDCDQNPSSPWGAICEPGVDGVSVTLLNGDGVVLTTTTTAHGGYYSFTNLAAGTYVVSFTLPSGYLFTLTDVSGNSQDGLDSDASSITGATDQIALTVGAFSLNVDAGLLAQPNLVASKSSVPNTGSPVRIGDAITYTVWFTNVGQTVAFNVPVTDTAPDGTVYVPDSAVPPTVSGPNPLTWDFTQVQPGLPYSVTFTVIVTGVPGTGTILNVAFVGNSPVTETNEVVHVFVPTAIQLASLTASRAVDLAGDPIVNVNWVVLGESNTLGYRVLRGAGSDRASASVISAGIIAASGAGGIYAWVDRAAPTGTTNYWIEEIGLDGDVIGAYGPAVVAPLLALPYRAYLPIMQ